MLILILMLIFERCLIPKQGWAHVELSQEKGRVLRWVKHAMPSPSASVVYRAALIPQSQTPVTLWGPASRLGKGVAPKLPIQAAHLCNGRLINKAT
jgi:hypothetical protein